MTHSYKLPSSTPRLRRLRMNEPLRKMLRETELNAQDFIYPLFIRHGGDERREICSMPGICQLSIKQALHEVEKTTALGIPAVLLFGIPETKDDCGSENFSDEGIIQQAIRAIKREFPHIIIITDVCMCEYTECGHCGIINTPGEHFHPELPEGYVLNDETLVMLQKIALSHVRSGADMVAPSGMMDGMVIAIRTALDENHFEHIPIMSYAVKYASSFYGPFREAAEGAPKFGDRKSHQMDCANAQEALREAALDIKEGADILMVKPALAYLDVIYRVKQAHPEVPLAAYNVSGEYAMIKAAAAHGWLKERETILEMLTAIKRAGAELIITYHALEAARWLIEGS